MKQLFALALAFASILTAAAQGGDRQKPAPPAEQQPPVFRAEANFVRVDAFPTKNGQPLHGLTADDFEVFEDGVLQKIASFEHVVITVGSPPETRREPNTVRDAERMAANPRNRVFVVYLDVPHVHVTSSHAIKEPLIRLLGRMMGPDDLVAVMTPVMTPTQMTFGRKTDVIERGLRENWPWGLRESVLEMDDREREYDQCYPPEPGEGTRSALAQELIDRRRERLVLDSVRDMLGYLAGVREERKAILMITEGWRLYRPRQSIMELRKGESVPGVDPIGVGPDGRLRRNPPTTRTETRSSKYECDADRMALAAMDNERDFRDLLDVANKANASFYPVDPRGLPVFDDSMGPSRPLPADISQALLKNKLETLKTLAENTDGLAILNNNDLDKGLKRVSDDLTSYYLLGYYSSNTKLDGGFRALKVRVKTPGVAVRARRGYRAATAAEVNAARTAATAPIPEGLATVGAAMSDLARIRPDMPFNVRAVPAAASGAATMSAVWVAGELQAGKEWAGGGAATIEVSGGGASTTASATLKPGERTFLVRIALATATAQADVRARFVPAESPVTLPLMSTTRVDAPVGLAQPLLFRRGPSTANRVQPAGSSQFSRSDRLRLEVSIGADNKPGAGRLMDKNGQPLQIPVTVSERTDESSGRWMVADVALASLGAGDYAIELTATAGGSEKKVVTAIRVTR